MGVYKRVVERVLEQGDTGAGARRFGGASPHLDLAHRFPQNGRVEVNGLSIPLQHLLLSGLGLRLPGFLKQPKGIHDSQFSAGDRRLASSSSLPFVVHKALHTAFVSVHGHFAGRLGRVALVHGESWTLPSDCLELLVAVLSTRLFGHLRISLCGCYEYFLRDRYLRPWASAGGGLQSVRSARICD